LAKEIHKPPESGLLVETETREDQFYVVSKTKLSILFLTTVGFYTFYWFYVNWRNYRDRVGVRLMPIPRAIFYIFFTHSLLNKVDEIIEKKQFEYKWSSKLVATMLVMISVVSNILDRLSFKEIGSPLTDILSLAILPFLLLILLKAQEAINLSQNDKAGTSNSRITIYNYIWIALGSVFWLSIGIGLMEMFGII
jgi:hypothetical protein